MAEEINTDNLSANDGTAPIPFKEPETNDKPEYQQDTCNTQISDEPVVEKTVERTVESFTDTGIFEFMTPERAIELYKRIHSNGIPDLEWKFHGRRQFGEQEHDETKESNVDKDETLNNDNQQNQTANTEFDFDEEFSDLQMETSIVNESLSLNRRPEPGSDKKTNLSDIMSDIMKETHTETE